MLSSISKSLALALGLLLIASAARAQSGELAERRGLESVWKKSGRTTRVIDYPFSPEPGKYGGPDTREWGNKGYIFINPKMREYRKITPLPPEKAPALNLVLEEEAARRQLEEEIARRKEAEAELKILQQEVSDLKEQAEDAIIKKKQLEMELEETKEKKTISGPGPSGTGGRLVVEKTDTYLVQKDDNLWKIAGRPEVYNDPYRWLLLYHANRDQIFEPDLIYAGMVLLVPRYRGMERVPPEEEVIVIEEGENPPEATGTEEAE